MSKIFIFFILFFLVTPTFISAHFTASDANFSAEMHVDPGDNPIINQPAVFHFSLEDSTHKFSPDSCTCTFTVIENGLTIHTQSLFPSGAPLNLHDINLSYTFSHSGNYRIRIAGEPVHAGKYFPTFNLYFNLIVTPAPPKNTSLLHVMPYAIAALLAAAVNILLMFGDYRRHRYS